tara:strand:+ start:801 stop:1262 length:462 start_codon:yes stop_codon:yes gene_type:complete
MPKPRTYTDEQFIEAVKTSMSYRQVLYKLGLKQAGGNYAVMKNRIKDMGLDTSHMTGQAHLKGKTHTHNKRPIEELLVENSNYQSHKLKLRLISEGLKQHKCECCGITEWNGQPAPIELDHIDGNRHNNTIENLRILCPNCHAQTDTYRGKNK